MTDTSCNTGEFEWTPAEQPMCECVASGVVGSFRDTLDLNSRLLLFANEDPGTLHLNDVLNTYPEMNEHVGEI